eukprot:gnl/TRDRNA2_/TRDRNA2_160849_c0_seq1.p1 gnl/TRDRNA2_/TRDRNA2_160849_c0~~gnl/TRDRNA2_/TRDRNA2_160849_c0_seq1.p1  ORF type:complete len:111 (-),score=21.82 gnl/TRDRNA2_/TRDRNA2_160849_c0_seq1:7-339(-)
MCCGQGQDDKVGLACYMLCCACLSREACGYCGRHATTEDTVVDSDADSIAASSASNISDSTANVSAGLKSEDVIASVQADAGAEELSHPDPEACTLSEMAHVVISDCVYM